MAPAVAEDALPAASPALQAPLPRSAILRLLRSLVHGSAEASGATIPRGFTRRLFDPALETRALGDLALGPEGIGLDSLALIDAAAEVARFFGLGSTGRDDYLLMSDRLGDWADLVSEQFIASGPAAALTFRTSGSVDAPTDITHTLADLAQEAATFTPDVFDPAPQRIIALVPPQHIYGFLFTCLYPAMAGCQVEDLSHRPAPSAHRLLHQGDVVIGTPLHWRRFLDAHHVFPDGVTGVVSAGPTPQDLWHAAAGRLDGFVEVYGATETGGIGWRRLPSAPFRVMSHLVRSGTGVADRQTGHPRLIQDRLTWTDEFHFTLQGHYVTGAALPRNAMGKLSDWNPDGSVRHGQGRPPTSDCD